MTTQAPPYDPAELREVLSLLTSQHRARVIVGVETNRQRHALTVHEAIATTADAEAVNATLLGADAETVADLRLAVWAVGLDAAGRL